MLKRSLISAAALVAVTTLAGCGDDASTTATDRPSREATGPACTYTDDGRPPADKVDLPPDHAAVSGQEKVTISTSAGDITATLDADKTPCTVNSFVSLADQGYFDGTECHRLTTQGIFVLQCGDPTGTGAGGPGYAFDDELDGSETYGAGTLAMANAGPNTNGSQFFLVYADSQLPPAYTVFGHIDDAGLKVVKGIADKGTADGGPDGAPKDKVEISSVKAD
ncbi:peptidyl-prolyl cis-trans isomerase B (cyclophilin B) [Nocardioides ginsengisegetis]|uniref:Peptidyl-prolyl cis-trans isomerase n=1 Tax=Nocardioides ginsengisegetis TaxID=661491 RepID=A0A7W3IZA3_9ACTN|nr:peptidylprolyl isomerase [Nocardioides ginsengisegetis]MBA8803358.1 peptidyl-prolyl cis-trans isomerase B (cyclophilin B) [Nocardioides ginsengisegetis]